MDSMKRWIRVIWNLISGEGEDGRSQIRSSVAMRTAIEHIERLDAHDVYNSLNCMPFDERTSDFSNRWNEEINKAKQIVCKEVRSDGKTWEEVITEAEQYAFSEEAYASCFKTKTGRWIGEGLTKNGNMRKTSFYQSLNKPLRCKNDTAMRIY